MAALGIVLGNVFWFGASVTVAGIGVVLFGLTSLSILPKAIGPGSLAEANAAIQMPRALCSFAVPLAVGLIVADVPAWTIFAAAALASVVALVFSSSLPRFDLDPKPTTPVLSRIVEGGRYVAAHRLLLPITLCSVFWNLAFAALLVVLIPVLQDVYRFDPGAFGLALAAFGLAAIFGSWLAGRSADRGRAPDRPAVRSGQFRRRRGRAAVHRRGDIRGLALRLLLPARVRALAVARRAERRTAARLAAPDPKARQRGHPDGHLRGEAARR